MDAKANAQKNKLQELLSRLDLCKRKIEALTTKNVALMFVSPARFVKKHTFDPAAHRAGLTKTSEKLLLLKNEPNGTFNFVHDPKGLGPMPQVIIWRIFFILFIFNYFTSQYNNLN